MVARLVGMKPYNRSLGIIRWSRMYLIGQEVMHADETRSIRVVR